MISAPSAADHYDYDDAGNLTSARGRYTAAYNERGQTGSITPGRPDRDQPNLCGHRAHNFSIEIDARQLRGGMGLGFDSSLSTQEEPGGFGYGVSASACAGVGIDGGVNMLQANL